MLYLHYEEIPGIPNAANPKLRQGVVRFVFSADPRFSIGQYISNVSINSSISSIDSNIMNAFVHFIKQIPASNRSFEPANKTWTVQKTNFDGLEEIARNFPVFQNDLSLIKWLSLNAFLNNQDPTQIAYINTSKARTTSSYSNKSNWDVEEEPEISEEEFFYTNSQPITQTQAKATIEQVLCQLFELPTLPSAKDELTKCYRKAAMKYHPDRNSGDSSKMSELNAAWQQYKIQTGV